MRLRWFIIGFVASWSAWVLLVSLRVPENIAHAMPDDMQRVAPEWYKSARFEAIGQFSVIAPAESSVASAILYPTEGEYPAVIVSDENSDGYLDAVTIIDRMGCHIIAADDDLDGKFDSYDFSAGIGKESIAFKDTNMDGEFEHRFGPDGQHAMMIDSKWRTVIDRNKKRYVRINDALTELEYIDAEWRIKPIEK